MVSTNYIRTILNEYKITQEMLANEWSKTYGKVRHQSNMPRVLKDNESTDSISLITAVSNLTKIKVVDLINELSLADQKIIYNMAAEPDAEYAPKNTKIPVTNIKSAASALMSTYNPAMVNKGFVSVPDAWIRRGVHKIAEISGESMLSTFSPNDLIASRLLEQNEWQDMRDNYIYEVVTTENESFIKRVRCNFEKGFLTCMSDNLDKKLFPNFNVDLSQISQIWSVEFKISWKFPSPYNVVDDRFKSLEKDQDEIRHIIQGLYHQMKQLKSSE